MVAANQNTDTGYRGPVACLVADITYRQLDYWDRTRLIGPSLSTAHGSGTTRLYSFADLVRLRTIKRLLDVGVSLSNIRTITTALTAIPVEQLTAQTILFDGVHVYQCDSDDQVPQLLAEGTAVIGVSVARVCSDVEQRLTQIATATTHPSVTPMNAFTSHLRHAG